MWEVTLIVEINKTAYSSTIWLFVNGKRHITIENLHPIMDEKEKNQKEKKCKECLYDIFIKYKIEK